MSRTRKGSKPLSYDYWSKRPYSKHGYGKVIKDMTHKTERAMSKEELYNENFENDSTQDHSWVVNWFKKNRGVDVEIEAQHPCSLDVIFDIKTGKWLGYVSDFCFIHDEMNCDICLDGGCVSKNMLRDRIEFALDAAQEMYDEIYKKFLDWNAFGEECPPECDYMQDLRCVIESLELAIGEIDE